VTELLQDVDVDLNSTRPEPAGDEIHGLSVRTKLALVAPCGISRSDTHRLGVKCFLSGPSNILGADFFNPEANACRNAIPSRLELLDGHFTEPLLQLNLPWERLMTDIVEPFDADKMFFIDGASVKATDLDRLKILINRPGLDGRVAEINRGMRVGDAKSKEMYAKQYHALMDAAIRYYGTDVTSQVVSAFKTAVKPKLTDHIDKKLLFDAAIKLVIEGTKAWAGHQ
jgi:hypothetical protein